MPRKTRTITKAALPKQAEHKFGSKAAAHVQDGGKAAPQKTTKKVGRKAAQAGPSSTNATQGGATIRAPSTSYARSPPNFGPSNFRGDIQEAAGFIQWWDEYKDQLSSLFSVLRLALQNAPLRHHVTKKIRLQYSSLLGVQQKTLWMQKRKQPKKLRLGNASGSSTKVALYTCAQPYWPPSICSHKTRLKVEDYQDNLLADLDDVRYSYEGDLVQYVEDDFIKTFMPRADARKEYADDPTWEDPEEDQDPEDDQRRDPEEDGFPQEGPEYDGGEWENHGDEPDDEEDADPKKAENAREDAQEQPDWSLLSPCFPGEGDGEDNEENAWTDEESVEERHELSPSHTSDPADDATDPWTNKGEMFHDGHSQSPWDPPEWREDEDDTTEDEDEFYDAQDFQDSAEDRPDEEDPYSILTPDYDYGYEDPKAIRKRVQFAPSAKSPPTSQYFENVDTFVPPNREEVYYSMPPGEAREQYTAPQGTWAAEVQQARQELAQAQESSWYPFRDHIDGMDTRPGRIHVNAAKVCHHCRQYGHIRPLCPDIWKPRVRSRSPPALPQKKPLDPLLKSAIISFLLDPSNSPPETTAVWRGRLPKKEGNVTFCPEPRATSADSCSTAEQYRAEWVAAARSEGIDPGNILYYERDPGWQAPWE
ncbi:hypothetical protein EDB87DRAFT_1683601 [Lactarius vividus]|nr:hypothetical protein EDB87DRAFT_1683601 [Lactarius vividus]